MDQSSDDKIEFSITEYLGRFRDAIMVDITLSYKDKYYDSIFFYNDKIVAITPDKRLENIIGMEIEEWEGYNDLILKILDKLPPYYDIVDDLSEIDVSKYGLKINE